MEVLSNGLPAKLLMLLLTVVMSTNMSGCRGTADAADTGQPPGVVNSATSTSANSINKEEIPQYVDVVNFDITDWKMSDISENILIDNIHISLPCDIDSLDEKFKITDNKLYYNDEWVGMIITSDNNIQDLTIFSDAVKKYDVSIGKIKYNTSYDEIVSIYGDQNTNKPIEKCLNYTFPQGNIFINTNDFAYDIDENNQVVTVSSNSFRISFVKYND